MYHLKPRVKNMRGILGLRSRDAGQGGTAQLGFVTYADTDNGDQTYQVSLIEAGGRSDHLADAIDKLCGNEITDRLVSAPVGDDAVYVGTPEQNARAIKEQQKAEAPASAKPELKAVS